MFSHAFDFAFEVSSPMRDASDVTPGMLRAALLDRINNLSDREVYLACNRFDTAQGD